MEDKKWIDKLKKMSKRAYVPYSNFHIIVFFENKDGSSFFGVNIENAAYGNTMCAERVAIHSAINDGKDVNKIKTIHVFSPDSNDFLYPCGACRQTMSEHINKDAIVRMYNNKGEFIEKKFEDILPFQFKQKNLKGNKK